jgi:hypothetical protein
MNQAGIASPEIFREYNLRYFQYGVGSGRFLCRGRLLYELWRAAVDCDGACGVDG